MLDVIRKMVVQNFIAKWVDLPGECLDDVELEVSGCKLCYTNAFKEGQMYDGVFWHELLQHGLDSGPVS